MQCAVWNTFGPVDRALQYAYGWSDATVAMMANWGTVMFILAAAPLSWGLEVAGLRSATLGVAALVAAGSAVRAASTDAVAFTVLSHVGSILNGVAGVTVMSAPPAISAVWFPPGERTTATSINQVANLLGSGVANLLGPYLVPDWFINDTSITDPVGPWGNSSVVPTPEDVRLDLQWYLAGLAAVSGFLLVSVACYFPARPPSPPSASGGQDRMSFVPAAKRMLGDRDLWLVALAYAVPCGVNSAWSAVTAVVLKDLGMDDSEAGDLSTASVAACAVVAVAAARVVDTPALRGRLRGSLLALNAGSAACFTWMSLLCLRVIPLSRWQLWASAVSGGCLGYAAAPLSYELASELSYPAPEGLTGAFLAVLNNAVAFSFLCLFFLPLRSTAWLSCVLAGSQAAAVPALAAVRNRYGRLEEDGGGTRSYQVIQNQEA